MSFGFPKAVTSFLVSILFSLQVFGQTTQGYRCLIRYENGFLAAGSGGRIDWISASGKKTRSEVFAGENFNCLLAYDQTVIAAGEKGSLLISTANGTFKKAESGISGNINSLALFRGTIIAVADKGEIITGDGKGKFKKLHLNLKGNIVSIGARLSECFGVTDAGEIIRTRNGVDWEITDFNKVYAGYYSTCYFTTIHVTENRIAIAGVRNDGSPVLMFSNQGNVWTERNLFYIDDQGVSVSPEGSPRDILYYEAGDEFYLAFTGGKIMKLPSCSHCNKLGILSDDDIEGISNIEDKLIVVGGNFFIRLIDAGF